MTGRFVGCDENADVAVLSVTHNSADHVDRLIKSLRAEAEQQRLRVVVVDNGSVDDTLRRVRLHDDVIAVDTGGNLGYAGGINVAMEHADDAAAVLVLNPDLWVQPGCILGLRERACSSGAGLVVPRITGEDGSTYPSIRREPSLSRALGDAALGSRLGSRPAAFSEIVGDPAEYEHAHIIEWATGAAVLIAARVARQVGNWDERFFLYSEETDYFRRAREAGATAWYEPHAVVVHARGGSGSSVELDSLLTVNRIRYVRKHHTAAFAGAYRAVVAGHELARSYQPAHRTTLRYVLSERTWTSLPTARPVTPKLDPSGSLGSVIIPAHNEAAVIVQTLTALSELAQSSGLDLIVSANGCSDETANRARSVPGVQVLELAEPSKTAALNAAELITDRFPRIYLDADVVVTPRAVVDTLEALGGGGVVAARPPYVWDLQNASWLVRRYYGVRGRIPSVHLRLWGAGVYGLSAVGRARFDVFPPVTADDLFVDQQFTSDERKIIDTDPVRVRVPRTTRALLGVLRRQSRGTSESGVSTSASTLRELLGTVRGPLSLLDACVYAALSLLARFQLRRAGSWERDESSRARPHVHEEVER